MDVMFDCCILIEQRVNVNYYTILTILHLYVLEIVIIPFWDL